MDHKLELANIDAQIQKLRKEPGYIRLLTSQRGTEDDKRLKVYTIKLQSLSNRRDELLKKLSEPVPESNVVKTGKLKYRAGLNVPPVSKPQESVPKPGTKVLLSLVKQKEQARQGTLPKTSVLDQASELLDFKSAMHAKRSIVEKARVSALASDIDPVVLDAPKKLEKKAFIKKHSGKSKNPVVQGPKLKGKQKGIAYLQEQQQIAKQKKEQQKVQPQAQEQTQEQVQEQKQEKPEDFEEEDFQSKEEVQFLDNIEQEYVDDFETDEF